VYIQYNRHEQANLLKLLLQLLLYGNSTAIGIFIFQ